MGPVGRVPPNFRAGWDGPLPTFENCEVNKSPKCTPFGIKCSKLRRLLRLRPRPRWGSLRRSSIPLVVRSFLPSAIAVPSLGLSSRSVPQQIAGPAVDKIKGQARATKLVYKNSVQNADLDCLETLSRDRFFYVSYTSLGLQKLKENFCRDLGPMCI